MTELSFGWPNTAVGDGAKVSVADSAAIFAALFGGLAHANSGVVPAALNQLAPTVSGITILVQSGWALVDGHPYRNSAQLTFHPVVPSTGTTGRRLVLRCTWAGATLTVRLTEITSNDGTATIPAMTQTSGTTYDIPICQYTVAITTGAIASFVDNRVFLGTTPSLIDMRALGGTLVPPAVLPLPGRVTIIDFKAISFASIVDTTDSVIGFSVLGGLVPYNSNSSTTNPFNNISGRVLTLSTVSTYTSGLATGSHNGGSFSVQPCVAPDRSPWMRLRMNPTAAGNANTSTRVWGFASASSGATPNGAYLRRNTTGNLFFVTRQGGSETTTDLGAQTNAERWYDIWTPDAGVTWHCFDQTGNLLATHTTNVPTVGTDLAVVAYFTSSSGGQTDFAISDVHVSMIDN